MKTIYFLIILLFIKTGYGQLPTTGKFAIILLPDTQYYTAEPQGTNGGNNTMFKREIRWIVNNRTRKNIVYVGQLGDCTNDGDAYEIEWKRSDTAMKLLENSTLTGLPEGIPYGICVGNHDQTPRGSATGTTAFYNKYFGNVRFNSRSYYGGHYNTDNDNFYDLFTVGNIDFLVISFEYDPSTNFTKAGGALDWGESLIKSYPQRNVIVLSHYVLKADMSFSVQGNNIYQRFKVYPNFKFMSGGHVPDSAAETVRVDTYNGNTVYTVLSNYQGRANGGNGRLRIYEFDPATNNVSVKTYSPYTNTYETDANSQFNMHISLITNSGTIANTYINSHADKVNQQNENTHVFKIYPNPARDILHVETNDNTTFSLFNQSGKILLTTNINKKGNIDISPITAGLYYLKNNGTGAVQKVEITR
jgi:hypothetical protein